MHNYKVVEYFLPDSDDVLCDSTRWVDHGGYEITLMSVPRQGEGEVGSLTIYLWTERMK